jgi:PAS domain S-box-containing protein
MSDRLTEKGIILIVDDTPANLGLLFALLANSGFKVLVARDGESAIEKLEYVQPDLILLDVLMGGMDGFETCRLLKAKESTKDIPVIFMTALTETVDKVKGLQIGAVDYITKPLQHEEVLARVNVHLSLRQMTKKLQEQNMRLEEEITERLRKEQKIAEQAALLDIATDAIFVRDLENKVLFWNKGAERLYGWKAGEALDKNANQLLNWETSPQTLQIILEQGEWQGELHQVTKDGKKIVVASRGSLVRDREGQPKSILTVNTDITEKKQLETQVLRAQRMESLGTLAGGIAHDLNNVLTPIMMVAQLLQLKLKDEQSQQWLEILVTNVKRGADLVKQVLSFARGCQGDRAILQVRHLIGEIKQIAKQTFPRSIEVSTDIPSDLCTVYGDATQLHQVLMNLCLNARDAMPNGGEMSIVAENIYFDEDYCRMNIEANVGAYIVISVADTGTGMSREIVERIFEPFFTTKELGQGTGLGLSTAIGIIKSHGGFVKVESEVGKGTQFKVYLPAMETMTTGDREKLSPSLPPGQGELILVVDDEDSICAITKSSLESNAYKVITASDGVEAVALYSQHKAEINVVVVDMMMPFMDGATTIRNLQQINPQVKIIAVSGVVSNQNSMTDSVASVKSFLPKPYTADELLKNLQLVLNTK